MRTLFIIAFLYLLNGPIIAQAIKQLWLKPVSDTEYIFERAFSREVKEYEDGSDPKTTTESCKSKTKLILIKTQGDTLFFSVEIEELDYSLANSKRKTENHIKYPSTENGGEYKVVEGFCSSKLTAKFLANGKFLGFANFKRIKQSALKSIADWPEENKKSVIRNTRKLLAYHNISSLIAKSFSYLPPNKDVAKGKWENKTIDKLSNIKLTSNHEYTFGKTNNGQANIVGKSKVLSGGDKIKAGKKQISFDLKGTENSNIEVNVNTGMPIKYLSKGKIEGDIVVEIEDKKIKVPMKIITEEEIKQISN